MRRVAAVLVLVVVAAACGDDDGAATTTAATTTTAAGSTTTGGTTTTLAPPDDCLVGSWTMGTDAIEGLLLGYLPAPNLAVTGGTLALEFTDLGLYTYTVDGLVVQITIPNGYLESAGTLQTNGTWATADGHVGFTAIGSDGGAFAWRAIINGVETPYPAGYPSLDIPLPSTAPYTCTETTLTLDETDTGTATRLAMVFTRAG